MNKNQERRPGTVDEPPAHKHNCAESTREPLAVLLLSTDILRRFSGRLSPEKLREQRAAMHEAARDLSGVLAEDGKANES